MNPIWKYLPMVVPVVMLGVFITVVIYILLDDGKLQESSAPTDATAATVTDDHANNRADATELTTSAEGRLEDGSRYFRIEIPEPLVVTVYKTGDTERSDPQKTWKMVGQLEDESGAVLDRDHDFYPASHFRLSAELDPGTYYVRVGPKYLAGPQWVVEKIRHTGSYTVHLDTAEIPPPLSLSLSEDYRFPTITSGALHTCALRADGTAVCWGRDRYGRASPPAGERFASISSGTDHTCGLRADGTPVCWRYDRYGQTSPPAGERFWVE